LAAAFWSFSRCALASASLFLASALDFSISAKASFLAFSASSFFFLRRALAFLSCSSANLASALAL